MEKRNKVIYWVFTGLLSVMMVMGPIMYFLKYDMVSEMFVKLGFPVYIIYPLATLKLFGVVAIITKKSQFLKGLAYAGFFFTFILAASAHINIGDGEWTAPIFALALLIGSYVMDKNVFTPKSEA